MKGSPFTPALLALAVLASAAGGYWFGQRQVHPQSAQAAATPATERPVLYWYDPMYPDQRFDQPGKSPFMDMDLIPKYADQGDAGSGLSIPAQTVQNLGMRTAPVLRGALPASLDAVGSLTYNQREIANLQARAAGFVERVYGRAPGDVVPAGAPLVDLLIPEWSAAQLEFIAVLADGDPRLIDAGRERLRLLGMPAALIEQVARERRARPVQTLRAPIAGELLELPVRAGMTVSAGQDLARINGLSTVWLDLAIPEAQAALARPGAKVRVQLSAYPGEEIQGKVIALLPSTDPQTRTLTLRSELPNPDGRLKPGMFARARLNDAPSQSALLIPSEALIRTGKRSLAMLADGDGRFQPQEIRTGRETASQVEVLAGLEEGQQVVVSGQFLLDSEASLRSVLTRAVPAEEPLHRSEGIIRTLEDGYVTLEHGPFPSLDMPGMTMEFPLASTRVAAGLKEGDKVRIAARQTDDGLVIEQLEKQGDAP